jgi:hypothetical protein
VTCAVDARARSRRVGRLTEAVGSAGVGRPGIDGPHAGMAFEDPGRPRSAEAAGSARSRARAGPGRLDREPARDRTDIRTRRLMTRTAPGATTTGERRRRRR